MLPPLSPSMATPIPGGADLRDEHVRSSFDSEYRPVCGTVESVDRGGKTRLASTPNQRFAMTIGW